jgi:hypothetical protein
VPEGLATIRTQQLAHELALLRGAPDAPVQLAKVTATH